MSAPNIIIISADQLTWRALPYYGNTYAQTPNINRFANAGRGFAECYCTCPLCQPSRASLWTGVYPHETNVLSNGRHWPVSPVPQTLPTLGEAFACAGYKAVHFGKTHDAGALRGFECAPEKRVEIEPDTPAWPLDYDTFNDRGTVMQAVDFLHSHGTQPYIMVADFNNPHDICNWVGAFRDAHTDISPNVPLPPLPDNFDFDDTANRALPVQYICCSHNRQAMTSEWQPESFRYYLAAYYHYLSRLDEEIGKLLDALEARGDSENTLIVFMADHGDGMAARRRVTKQVDLYEEVTRVPFIFKGPGVASAAPFDAFPVSTLDLFPTLCGYAGIDIPHGLRGIDLTPLLKGESAVSKREYVASEWHTEWGYTVSPGRMLRTQKYKYIHYLEGNFEELYDLEKDQFEKINVAKHPEYTAALLYMRGLFESFLRSTNDGYRTLQVKADARWRSHKLGYMHHRGPAAPEATEPNVFFKNNKNRQTHKEK